jgi:hypothetical protein
LSAERGETCAGNLRHPPVAWVGKQPPQRFTSVSPSRLPSLEGRLAMSRRNGDGKLLVT